MDIDTTKGKSNSALTCQRCRHLGHFAKDCDQRFDIRHMSTDKIQTILENMLAEKDAVADLPTEELEEIDEDFVCRSQ